MKKWLHVSVGIALGFALSLSVTVAAEHISKVGKRVEAEVTVVLDGSELDVPAIIIDGMSFAPIRLIGEMVGRKVDWQGGKVVMSSVKEPIMEAPDVKWPRTDVPLEEWPRQAIEGTLGILKSNEGSLRLNMEVDPLRFNTPENRERLAAMQAEIEMYEQRLAEILEEEAAE